MSEKEPSNHEEIALKEHEEKVKVELDQRALWFSSPLLIGVVSAIFGLLGTLFGAALQGYSNLQLERQKFEFSLIQKALDTDNQDEAARNLMFLVNSGVIQSLDGERIRNIAENPEQIPFTTRLQISSDGAQATATVGDSRISNYNRADIIISALQVSTGEGIDSLAPKGHTGDSNSVIPFPAGWSLDTKLVPPGGCVLQPTHIYNDGAGGYTLSVMTVARSGSCPWLQGEYRYQIRISVAEYQGSSIGKIVIE
ncbi:MAG: hypothetical protein AB4372_23815 [Xenococcus sp. (in: cyanobacteria)]